VFTGFCAYREALAACDLNVLQWVDGSFNDRSRLDPEDVDVVNFVSSSNLNAAAVTHGEPKIRALLDGRETTKGKPFYTHSFLEVCFPAGHPMASSFEAQIQYWRYWLGMPQDYTGPVKVPAPHRGRKGIVQMVVGTGTLYPEVSAKP
jgi:hypothetical protein